VSVYYKRDEEFDNALRPAAMRHGVPLWLAKGLISMESGWDPGAVRYEPSGRSDTPAPTDIDASFGLMQVTGGAVLTYGERPPAGLPPPATSTAYAVQQVRSAQTGTDPKGKPVFDLARLRTILSDPTLNIDVGMRELAAHLAKYGDAGSAVASYNMGFPRTIQNSTRFIATIYDKWAIRQGYGSYVANFDKWIANPPDGWTFANQPYVNDVLARAALYRAREQGNTVEEARIHAFLARGPWPAFLGSIRSLLALPAAASSSASSSPSSPPSPQPGAAASRP